MTISTDKKLLNTPFIHAFISSSYWAEGRTYADMQTCIDRSLNFGVYLEEAQIGYARVVSDTVQFDYLMDVFIDPAHRGKGYSKKLMQFILSCPELEKVKVWRLATKDAQELYKQFGFRELKHPENMLELMR